MPNDSNRPDVAVFIDFENVYVSVRDKLDANPNFESIMDRCEDLGRVVIARAYADWYRYPRVTSALYANGIEPMYVPTYYYDRDLGRTGRAIKNSVDMNLCVDAMKTLFTNPNIAKFVLATGDRDFIPLVNTIRQQGKEVIVIGIGGAASAHLAQSADEFIFYEALIGKSANTTLLQDKPNAKMPQKGREQEQPEEQPARPPVAATNGHEPAAEEDVFDVLVKAIKLARERGYVCSFGSLKLLMKELMGGEFKEGRYKDGNGRPLAKFKDFVLEAERRGKVQVFTNGTVNEVFLPGEDPYKLSQFAQELNEEATQAEPETPAARAEQSRPAPTGRARRRRRPRGQRQSTQAELEETSTASDEDADETEALDPLETVQQADDDFPVAPQYDPVGELFLPDLDEPQADMVFEGLLERIEQEDQTDRATLEALHLLTGRDEPSSDDAAPTDEGPSDVEGFPAPVIGPSFTDDEWNLLRQVVADFNRPVSFAQIHDSLREARNRADTELTRTNEELRTLIKQAINSGMLMRIGKGNRISYQIPPPAEEDSQPEGEQDQLAQVEQAVDVQPEQPEQPVEATLQPDSPEATDQMAQVEQAVNAQPEQSAEVAAPDTELVTPDALPDQAETLQEVHAEQPPTETLEVVAPSADAVAEALVEPPVEKPKRTTRRRKKADEPAPAETPAAEASATEEKPKRTTRRRKKADTSAEGENGTAATPAPESVEQGTE